MKNFIKFIFLFFIGVLFLGSITETCALQAVSGRYSCAFDSISCPKETSLIGNDNLHHYSQIQKALWNCEISSVNSKNNTLVLNDNKCAISFNNKFLLRDETNCLKYIYFTPYKISYILKNAVIARAP